MNEQFVPVIVGVVAVSMLFMAFALLWLMREHKKLRQNHQQLAKQIQRASDDLSGLCAAAIAVDSRIAANESRMAYLLENINLSQSMSPAHDEEEVEEVDEPQGYALAIEKIRHGANVEELVKRCGLTRDEAVLLMRLHGKDRN